MNENYLSYFIFPVIALLHTDCSHTGFTSDTDFECFADRASQYNLCN